MHFGELDQLVNSVWLAMIPVADYGDKLSAYVSLHWHSNKD